MRLWTLHPKHLDRQGLVALWREGLLARKVLLGQTKGYTNHPQLDRFKNLKDSAIVAIDLYLSEVADEATSRNYKFDKTKIQYTPAPRGPLIFVNRGQVIYEASHLKNKLSIRCPERKISEVDVHPLFIVKENCTTTETWEAAVVEYKPLKEVVKNILKAPERGGLSRPIKGSGYLEAGWHNVTITAVDCSRLEDQGRVIFTFDSQGVGHRESLWLMARDGQAMSYKFQRFLNGLLGDHVVDFLRLWYDDRISVEMFRGMRLSIKLEQGSGYVLKATGGGYQAVDAVLGLHLGEVSETLGQARKQAESKGYKRSYPRITKTECSHGDSNFEAIQDALAARSEAPEAPGSFAAYMEASGRAAERSGDTSD